MARYGDLERLEQHFYNCADECRNTCDEWGAKCFETAMKATKNQPTADVVPRAEVDKARQQGYESGKREVAREILEKAASKFAGHSDYHGDTILQVLYCMAEGKEVNNAKPLNSKQSEDVTDINDGHKPTEEGDYFTPAQVRAMSAKEVKANYAKILTSMSRWH